MKKRALKTGGDYQAYGWVISEFTTLSGEPRVVFEFEAIPGMLHIFTPQQIEFIKIEPILCT